MARTKISVYLTPDTVENLKRLAATDNRSLSDLIETAILEYLSDLGSDVHQAALMARFDQVIRRLGVIEKGVESHFELTAHATRFAMSMAPEIHETQLTAFNIRGAERFRNILSSITTRLASGRSFWRETLAGPAHAQDAHQTGAHQTGAHQAGPHQAGIAAK